jgi:hypothetical protein
MPIQLSRPLARERIQRGEPDALEQLDRPFALTGLTLRLQQLFVLDLFDDVARRGAGGTSTSPLLQNFFRGALW